MLDIFTSKSVKSKRFHDGAAALNRLNMWMPPPQVKLKPSKNMINEMMVTKVGFLFCSAGNWSPKAERIVSKAPKMDPDGEGGV